MCTACMLHRYAAAIGALPEAATSNSKAGGKGKKAAAAAEPEGWLAAAGTRKVSISFSGISSSYACVLVILQP